MMKEINLANLDVLAEGDLKFRNELLDAYIILFKEFFEDAPNQLTLGLTKELRESIHKVKSGVRMLGAKMLDEHLTKLDDAAKEGRLQSIEKERFKEGLSAYEVVILSQLEEAKIREPKNGARQ
jgi:hypothetical protein